ncbi:hypothetical protein HELRODRAFT_89886 [Helobdella robusta]|uniref:NFU1 iron-sulfur cluster scaffold homolog, mitochondrial n=1 Tax=Helobdella robusta TaxID=6412 RepID=T1G7I8_HELRO|nr:hypothetical protein HELRODRAFT_89886 [Helobdella robusta]ESN92108.1 hypothetical protein HELRODRAFT_89886 [Helobdella robusta]
MFVCIIIFIIIINTIIIIAVAIAIIIIFYYFSHYYKYNCLCKDKRSLFIEVQETPNPNSLKFLPQRAILQDGVQPRDYPTPKSTFDCSLASQLHQINGVSGVYIGRDFITISKSDDVSWANIDSEVRSLLMEYFSINKHVNIAISTSPSSTSSRDVDEENEDEVIEMIKELIESKIRPTVQEDGGDIVYVGFEEGIVKVKLQGSCTTCPSSEVTLKRGVQNMLQFYVPEVLGVVQVEDEKDELSNKEFEKLDSSLDKDSKEN